MSFCIITPDRNDRPELLNHCIWQMSRQTAQPAKHYIVNWPAVECKTPQPDIVPRIQKGIKQAIADGFEFAFIIENDDYYPANYLETMFKIITSCESDFIGIEQTIFYMFKTCEYIKNIHPRRASLFCTGFKLSAMENFNWPELSCLYLDMKIWDFAQTKTYTLLTTSDKSTLNKWPYPVGIKHGKGYSPGTGHNNKFNNTIKDKNYTELRKIMPYESFKFYNENL